MLCEDVTKTEDAGQVLDAFQQVPEPISGLYMWRLWCRPTTFVSAHRIEYHPKAARRKVDSPCVKATTTLLTELQDKIYLGKGLSVKMFNKT